MEIKVSTNVVAPVDKAVQIIADIAENAWADADARDDKTLIFTSSQSLAIGNAIQTLSKEQLSYVQTKLLKTHDINISQNLPGINSQYGRLDAIKEAILNQKRERKETIDTQPAVGTVQIKYFEKPNYRYFAVTPKGDLVCLIPFMACNETYISSENTCKTGETMRETFFPLKKDKADILEKLEAYLDDLTQDLNLLVPDILNNDTAKNPNLREGYLGQELAQLKSTNADPIICQKLTRYLQLIQYKNILEQIIGDPVIKTDLTSEAATKQLPTPIQKVLQKSNAVSFLIAPQSKAADYYVKLSVPRLCSFEREKLGSPGNTYTNPKYADGFVNTLHNHLLSLQKNIANRKSREAVTKEQLIDLIVKKYAQKASAAKTDSKIFELPEKGEKKRDATLTTSKQTAILRDAIIDVVADLGLQDPENFKKAIGTQFFQKDYSGKQTAVSHEAVFDNFDDMCGLDCTVRSFIPFILSSKGSEAEMIDQLVDESNNKLSPFDNPTMLSPEKYNDLIQMFISIANIGYFKQTKQRDDFGQRIERESESLKISMFNIQKQKKQVSLIQAIKKAITDNQPIEDTILTWLEEHLLAEKSGFEKETKDYIKTLFNHTCQLLFNPYETVQEIDEFLILTKNDQNPPQIVSRDSTMAVPLDIFCQHYDKKFWLKEKFQSDSQGIYLPLATELKLEDDKIAVSNQQASASVAKKIDVMQHLSDLIAKNELTAAATFLLHKTMEGKRIYTLLNNEQIGKLNNFNAWKTVLNSAAKLLPPSETKLFNAKFKLGFRVHITKEQEYMIYTSALENRMEKDQDKDFEKLKHEDKIKRGLWQIITFDKGQKTTFTQTTASTYILDLPDQAAYEDLQKFFKERKNILFISPDMVAGLYKQIDDDDINIAPVETSRVASHMEPIPASAHIKDTAKFPKALKELFPDLTIKTVNAEKKKGKPVVVNPDPNLNVIQVSYNPSLANYGYRITSSNPDNLYRIRERCELSMTHVLSGLEAAKLLQKAVNSNLLADLHLPKPIELTLPILEKALEALNITHISIKEVGLTYEIICTPAEWKKLTAQKETILTIDSHKVTLEQPKIDPQIVKDFFKAIDNADISAAQRLLGMYPALLNARKIINEEKQYHSTPLIDVLFQADKLARFNINASASKQRANTEQLNRLLDFCLYLLEQPGINLAQVDSMGSSALFRAIYYNKTPDNPDSGGPRERFLEVALAIWGKARIEGSQDCFKKMKNTKGESILSFGEKFLTENFYIQDFWDLLEEGRYYDFKPALEYYSSNTGHGGKFFPIDIWTKQHPKTQKYPLQMALEKRNIKAVTLLLSFTQGRAALDSKFDVQIDNQLISMNPFEFVLWMKKDPKYSDVETQKTLKEIRDLMIKNANASNHIEWMETLHAKEQQASKELQQAEKKINELNRQLEDIEKQTGKLSEKELTQITKNIPQLKEELQQQTQLASKLKKELENSQDTLNALENNITALNQQINLAQTEKSDNEQKLSLLTKENEDLQKKVNTQSEAKTKAQEKLDKLNEEIPKLSGEEAQLQTQFSQLTNENQQLSKQVDTERSAYANLQKSLLSLQTENKQLEVDIKTLEIENTKISQELPTHKEEVEKLHNTAKSLETQKQQLDETCDNLQKTINGLKSEAKTLNKNPIFDQKVARAVAQELEDALSQTFFMRLQRNSAYQKLVSRIDEIQKRPINSPLLQDVDRNKQKAAALLWLKNAVEGKEVGFTIGNQPALLNFPYKRKAATFQDVHDFLNSDTFTLITQSTRKQEGFLSHFVPTGEVTSKELLSSVKQLFETEHGDREKRERGKTFKQPPKEDSLLII